MERTVNESEVRPSHLSYTVDSFDNGIAFGQHRGEESADQRDFFSLRIADDSDLVRLRSRYALHQKDPLIELERHLMRLSSQGVLRSSLIYFGITTDPFHPFQGKFDASMRFLELFNRYTPGMLVVQTRSPLVVIAMPVLKRLGQHAAVTIGVETCDEDAARRYTPGLPRVDERLKAASALRRFGIPVTLQVSPVLPYGDWRKDAPKFAEVLAANGDYIHLKGLTDGSERTERQIRQTVLAQKLAEDRKFHWLRKDTPQPLFDAVEKIDPKLLRAPEWATLKCKQLRMFAA